MEIGSVRHRKFSELRGFFSGATGLRHVDERKDAAAAKSRRINSPLLARKERQLQERKEVSLCDDPKGQSILETRAIVFAGSVPRRHSHRQCPSDEHADRAYYPQAST